MHTTAHFFIWRYHDLFVILLLNEQHRMKQRIAVIFEGNISNRLGVFNAVVNRVKHLRAIDPYDIDLFMIQV